MDVARWVLSRLRSAFDLVFALDEVYRNRYRDPSRGIERAPIAIREAGNRNLDYLDHLTKAVQGTIAALADAKENRQRMDGE